MGTVWNVMIDLKLGDDCDVKEMVKKFEKDVKGTLPKGCETYNAICSIFQNLEEDLDEMLEFLNPCSLFIEDTFDGSYGVGQALYNAFNKPFGDMPFEPGSKIIFDSWEDAGGRFVIEKLHKKGKR